MTKGKVFAAGFLAALSLLCTALFAPPDDSQATGETATSQSGDLFWMNWDPHQHALADDGQSIWIGATGSVLEWGKAMETAQRYGPTDGLFHRRVRAVAVDGSGNRWFGGDAGLSRVDPAGDWTHYSSENSDLADNFVDGIAVGADGTLWLSHGLPGGSVSRRDLSGAWQHYSDRQTAVTQAYDQVVHTVNANDLWAVAGEEVWVGYDVYDGARWENRRPPNTYSDFPAVIRADSSGGAWALTDYYGSSVYAWDGSVWLEYIVSFGFYSGLTALSVGPDNAVWVGYEVMWSPYDRPTAGVYRLPEEPPGWNGTDIPTGAPGPVTALLPTAEGVWAIGPAWLLQPDEMLSYIDDVPRGAVTHTFLTADGSLFVHSGNVIQTVDDRGTTALGDDRWRVATDFPVISAIETLNDGDAWIVGYFLTRVGPEAVARRYHQGQWLDYTFGPFGEDGDVFAQSARTTWFTFDERPYSDKRGAIRLDDGGTPARSF